MVGCERACALVCVFVFVVYLDAVFHPRCINDPKVFEQEGWHYELDSPEVCVCVCVRLYVWM